ncbi:MAG TPA: hypothetical protein VIK39_15510 [Candidatus Angelobacter sp.]
MRSRLFVLSVLVCAFGLVTVVSAQSTFVYAANTLGGSISIYKLNTTSGALTPTGDRHSRMTSPVTWLPPQVEIFWSPAVAGARHAGWKHSPSRPAPAR